MPAKEQKRLVRNSFFLNSWAITFCYSSVRRASTLLEKIALNSKRWAFGSLIRLQDFLFLDETGTDFQSPKGCTWKNVTLSVTAHHHDSTCSYFDCGQERKQNDNADNPLCLGTQIYHESAHGYSAERLTSLITSSVAITLYLLWLLLTESAHIYKTNQISRKHLSVPLKYTQQRLFFFFPAAKVPIIPTKETGAFKTITEPSVFLSSHEVS